MVTVSQCPMCCEAWDTEKFPVRLRCSHNVCAVCCSKMRRCPTCRVSHDRTASPPEYDPAYDNTLITMRCGTTVTFSTTQHVCERAWETQLVRGDPGCVEHFRRNYSRPCVAAVDAAIRADCVDALNALLEAGVVVASAWMVEVAHESKACKLLDVLKNRVGWTQLRNETPVGVDPIHAFEFRGTVLYEI